MYTVKIKNKSEEIIIHDDSINSQQKIIGTVTEEINSIPAFNFTIYINNPGYYELYPLTTEVSVIETNTSEVIFEGRVLQVSDNMDSSGLFYKEVICEGILGYLCDSVPLYTADGSDGYVKFVGTTVLSALSTIIMLHNQLADDSKKFIVAEDDYFNSKKFENYSLTPENSTWKTIQKIIMETAGGEVYAKRINGQNWIFLKQQQGEKITNTTIEIAKNLENLSAENDFSDFCTRIIPIGKDHLRISGVSQSGDISVHDGVVDSISGIAQFGVIAKPYICNDILSVEKLTAAGINYLKSKSAVLKRYSITALDLSYIDRSFSRFRLGNSYRVINSVMGIDEHMRIVRKTTNLSEPYRSEIEIGDKYIPFTMAASQKWQSFSGSAVLE